MIRKFFRNIIVDIEINQIKPVGLCIVSISVSNVTIRLSEGNSGEGCWFSILYIRWGSLSNILTKKCLLRRRPKYPVHYVIRFKLPLFCASRWMFGRTSRIILYCMLCDYPIDSKEYTTRHIYVKFKPRSCLMTFYTFVFTRFSWKLVATAKSLNFILFPL